MKPQITRFEFSGAVRMAMIQTVLELALLGLSLFYGARGVDIRVIAKVNRDDNSCEIDTSGEVGQRLAWIFQGYAARQFGSSTFTVSQTRLILPHVDERIQRQGIQ
jgi:hypothetical protein